MTRQARRRIKKADIKFVSLVPKGANRLPVLYKEDDGSVHFEPLTKYDEDKGEIVSIVYTPENPDSEGDIASKETITDMAHSFMRNGSNLDIRHDGKSLSKEQAHVAESFIVQKNDARFINFKDSGGEVVDTDGAWCTIIKVDDPDIKSKYKTGEWGGVSLFGPAEIEILKEDRDIVKIIKDLFSSSNKKTDGDSDMDIKELAKLLKENNESLTKELKELIKPSETTVVKEDEKVTLEDLKKAAMDSPSVDNISKYSVELQKQEILDDVEWSDSESIAEAMEGIKKIEQEATQKKRELSKAKRDARKSNVSKQDDSNENIFGDVTKEEVDAAKQMTELINN